MDVFRTLADPVALAGLAAALISFIFAARGAQESRFQLARRRMDISQRETELKYLATLSHTKESELVRDAVQAKVLISKLRADFHRLQVDPQELRALHERLDELTFIFDRQIARLSDRSDASQAVGDLSAFSVMLNERRSKLSDLPQPQNGGLSRE